MTYRLAGGVMMRAYYATGLRRNELLAVRHGDLQREKGRIFVRFDQRLRSVRLQKHCSGATRNAKPHCPEHPYFPSFHCASQKAGN